MDLADHIAAWERAMAETEYFSLDKTPTAERPGLWDRLSHTYDLALGSDTARVERTMAILEQIGALTPQTVAIDIGCGTGSFALELAKKCERVYAIDTSPGMLEQLAQKAKGIPNLIPVLGDWNEIAPGDLDPRVNLALSCLNPGIRDFKSLDKMNTISKAWCCYISALGNSVGTDATRNELQELILGSTLRSAGGNSVIFPQNILTAMGYAPQLWEIPCAWTRSVEKAEAVDQIIADYSRFTEINAELSARIEVYITSKLDKTGRYTQTASTTLGALTWR